MTHTKVLRTVVAGICMTLLVGCMHSNINKGETCLRLGDYPAAIGFFTAELQKRPDCYRARLGLGKAMLQKSADEDFDTLAWKQGLIHLEAARTLAPAQESEKITDLLSDAWVQQGRALLAAYDTISALAALARAIEFAPHKSDPLNLAGILYFRLGEEKKAVALFRKAAHIDSAGTSAHFNLGMVYWQSGDIVNAHKHWLIALKRAPGDEDLLYWFAIAEKKLREMPAP